VIAYILRRLLGAVIVVFCVFSISFLIMRMSPGSPFDQEKEIPPTVVSNQAETTGMAEPIPLAESGKVLELRAEKNADIDEGQVYAVLEVGDKRVEIKAPQSFKVFRVVRKMGEAVGPKSPIVYAHTGLAKQYLTTLSSYARFDFGVTFDSNGQRTVKENIVETLPVSMELGFYALVIALLLGITSGLLAGLRHNTWVDYSVMSAAMFGISVPAIVLGPLFILIFIMTLEWLPPHGGWEPGLFTSMGQKVLPSITLGLAYAAYFARLTRGGMLEVTRQDWMRTARAKGMPERVVVFRHALKGAILPAVTFLGPAAAHLMVGSVVVEAVYNIPGIAKYFITSAINRDYPMVMGVVVVYSVFLVLFNLAVDIAYAYLDPRVKYE
jgi:oligopeptide transport system permease protein